MRSIPNLAIKLQRSMNYPTPLLTFSPSPPPAFLYMCCHPPCLPAPKTRKLPRRNRYKTPSTISRKQKSASTKSAAKIKPCFLFTHTLTNLLHHSSLRHSPQTSKTIADSCPIRKTTARQWLTSRLRVDDEIGVQSRWKAPQVVFTFQKAQQS